MTTQTTDEMRQDFEQWLNSDPRHAYFNAPACFLAYQAASNRYEDALREAVHIIRHIRDHHRPVGYCSASTLCKGIDQKIATINNLLGDKPWEMP